MLHLVSLCISLGPLYIYQPKKTPSISVQRHYDVIYDKMVKTEKKNNVLAIAKMFLTIRS